MKIQLLEKVDDDYINIYEVGIFVRAVEYSAIICKEIFDYKLTPNIERRTGFVYIEIGFPKNILQESILKLQSNGYSLRYIDKNNQITIYNGNKKDFKKDLNLEKIKRDMIKFS